MYMRLTHCRSELLPVGGPGTVTITTVEGPGQVEVLAAGALPPVPSVAVPPGGSVVVSLPGPIGLHYRQDPAGPDEIVIDVELTPL